MTESTKIASKEYADKHVKIDQSAENAGKAMIVDDDGNLKPRSLLNTHTHTINEIIDFNTHTHIIDEIIDFPLSFYGDEVKLDMTGFYEKFEAIMDYIKERVEYVQSQIRLHATKDPIDHPKGSIITEKILNSAVITSKISDLNVTAEKLANSLDLTGKTITVSAPPL